LKLHNTCYYWVLHTSSWYLPMYIWTMNLYLTTTSKLQWIHLCLGLHRQWCVQAYSVYWEWTELGIPAKTTELQCLLIKHVFWLTVGV
jgi:hypothetical protein